MNLLDLMLRDHVTPALADAGFRKDGRNYRLVAANGDQAIVGFQRSRGSDGERVLFYVNVGVVPASYQDWLAFALPNGTTAKPGPESGLWQDRLMAAPEVAGEDSPWGTDLWLLAGAESVAACGEQVVRTLADGTLPLLARLLDRREFLALTRDESNPLGGRVGPAEVMLLIDEGPSEELDAEIADCEATDPRTYPMAPKLAAWARQRLAGK